MNKGVILFLYAKAAIIVAVVIWVGIMVVKGKRFIKWEKAHPSKQELMKRNELKINTAIRLVLSIISLVVIISYVVPLMFDLPYVIKEDYLTVSGFAVTNANGGSGHKEERIVSIEDETTGEVVRVKFTSERVKKGDYLVVSYLPYSKEGVRLNDE